LKKYVAADYECLRTVVGKRCEGSLEFAGVARLQNRKVHSQGLCVLLQFSSFPLGENGVGRVNEYAINAAAGTISCKSSRRFASSAPPLRTVTPLTFEPGRSRLVTKPAATGSTPIAKTIGIDLAAAFGTTAPAAPANATMTET